MCIAVIATFIATPSSGAAFPDSLPLTRVAPVQLSAPGGASTPSGYSGAQRIDSPRVRGLGSSKLSRSETCRSARRAVKFYRARYLEHRRLGLSNMSKNISAFYSAPCPKWLAHVWQRKARAARLAFERWFERTYAKWRCVHEHEGAWNDPNPPHYGGLQFDDSFQRTYGPSFFARWGDAGNWPVWAQLVAAERAYQTRGFYPWPNTARACGLI